MSEISMFDHKDYRQYLEKKMRSELFGRGGKAKLAQHLNCQPSFVSQVLKGKSSFNLEQAFKINSFLKHNPLEKEYFMTLIEWDRAGTVELKEYFEEKRLELIEKSKLVEHQMEYDQLSKEDTAIYYSNVNHILARNLIEIPKYNTRSKLKKKLDINDQEFKEVMDFLIDPNLVSEKEDGTLEQGQVWIHLKKGSPIVKFANITARMHILKNFEQPGNSSMYYTSFVTLPRSSFDEFKKKFSDLIAEFNNHLQEEDKAEMMAALAVDFLEI
ncbi:MAG: DUF4423 domain-containing protein [Bdellovibrionales bacterium]|nr:DUF4423 domain-containing protein [Bdellovibrionales bacterium]NQZ19853.1 DUF4423 domain-containing protein [Bdellovibrionales bacterium]